MLSVLVVLCALSATTAFAPSPATTLTIKAGRTMTGMKPTYVKRTLVRMSEEKPSEETEKEAPVAPAKGEAFYDDEYDSAPQKSGLSDSMKARLMAEASTGLDSEVKQNNVILYIIGAVGVLVILGGQGIFY